MTKSNLVFAKLDPGFFSNRKARRAGPDGQRVFLFAVCLNAARGAKGWVPIEDFELDYLAEQLQFESEEQAQRAFERARNARLVTVDGDRVFISGWDEDWARGPRSNAERQADWRKRHHGSNDDFVTRNENITRNGSEERRGDQRETRVTRVDSLSGFASESPRESQGRPQPPESTDRRAAESRAAIDVDSWTPPAALLEFARSLGCDPKHELDNFRSYAAERDNSFRAERSICAAFERFCRNSRDRGANKPKPALVAPKRRKQRLDNGREVEIDDDGQIVGGP